MEGRKALQQGSVENAARQVQGWVWELAADGERGGGAEPPLCGWSSLKTRGDKTAPAHYFE